MSALTFHKVEYAGRCNDGCSRSAMYAVLLLGYPLDGEGTRTVVCGRCRPKLQQIWDESLGVEQKERVAA